MIIIISDTEFRASHCSPVLYNIIFHVAEVLVTITMSTLDIIYVWKMRHLSDTQSLVLFLGFYVLNKTELPPKHQMSSQSTTCDNT